MRIDIAPFSNYILDRYGMSFEGERASVIEKAVRKRRLEKGLNAQEYFALLVNNEDESLNLINLLTVNETYFYREQAHFDVLCNRIMPDLFIRKRPGEKIRILSAGCSTGEEPYSIMISLLEKFGPGITTAVEITGIDVDVEAIKAARTGEYRKHSFRSFSESLKCKYFHYANNGMLNIKENLKPSVEFHVANLKSTKFTEYSKRFDVIFYRNVSIYFPPEVQRDIFNRLSKTLNDDGYLIVSSTETFFHNIGVLSLIEVDGTFLYKKRILLDIAEVPSANSTPHVHAASHKASRQSTAKRHTEPKTHAHTPEAGCGSESFNKALTFAKEKRYSDALKLLDECLDGNPSSINALSLKSSIFINQNKFESARRLCLKSLEMDNWNLESHILLGFIAMAEKNEQETIKRFKEAVYISPSSWLPHFFIAEAYHAGGELERAHREYSIVVKLLARGSQYSHGLTLFPIAFSSEQILHLCKHNMENINKRLHASDTHNEMAYRL